jgi:hypothetical protein
MFCLNDYNMAEKQSKLLSSGIYKTIGWIMNRQSRKNWDWKNSWRLYMPQVRDIL